MRQQSLVIEHRAEIARLEPNGLNRGYCCAYFLGWCAPMTTGLRISGDPSCRKTGVALLSDVNEYSLDIQMDAVPEGFEVVRSKQGIEF
jgi:hypothetical protein